MKRLLLAVVFLVLVGIPVKAYSLPGNPTGYVNDYANILSVETKQQLETRLSSLDASTSAQVSVVTIKSLEGDTIENFANKLFEDWGIGQKGKDNGVLLLVAVDDREVRIEVGYGLEGALTDAETSWIIRDKITPRFKEGNYSQGAIDGVEGILTAAAEDLQVTSMSKELKSDTDFPGIAMFGFFGLQWLWAIMARTKSWWLGGVVGGIIGLIIYLFAHSLFAFISIPLGLLFDYLVSKQYKQSTATGSYPWWIGGKSGFGGGFSGGRSGGFGGFGGGRSGGGGSSGRW